jgi:hypothetical protein
MYNASQQTAGGYAFREHTAGPKDWDEAYFQIANEESPNQKTFGDRLLGVAVMLVISAIGWTGIIFVARLFW